MKIITVVLILTTFASSSCPKELESSANDLNFELDFLKRGGKGQVDAMACDSLSVVKKLLKHIQELENSRIFEIRELTDRVKELEYLRRKDAAERDRQRQIDFQQFDLRLSLLKYIHENDSKTISNLIQEVQVLSSQNNDLNTKLITLHRKLSSVRGRLDTEIDKHENQTLTGPQQDIRLINIGKNTSKFTHPLMKNDLVRTTSNGERAGPAVQTIAFHSVLVHSMLNVVTDQTVIFDWVITNVGAQYSSMTGIFTCSQDGVYVFSWTLRVNAKGSLVHELVRNGVVIGSADTGGYYETSGSSTAAVELVEGDKVWVRVGSHFNGTHIYPVQSSFTGFLIQ